MGKQTSQRARVKRRRVASAGASEQMLQQVRGQVEPAFGFAVSYLRLLSEQLGLGALAVWFGTEGIEKFVSGRTREFEWQDDLAALLRSTTSLGPHGQSAFCNILRRSPEADRRCHECDAKWIARARKSGRSWAYQCHAGLSEVIAPIVVNGKRIGEVMGGQLASVDELPRGFDDVWQRVRDIDGLDRESLREAFGRVRTVDKPALSRIRARLQTAARALGALIESVASLMSREALLGQVRSYLERDFAWFALTQPDATQEEVGSRARTLGFSAPPSVVFVIQIDRTSRATFGQPYSQTAAELPTLFEGAQRLLRDEPNSMVCSIRPGELVVLLTPRRTRNPSLRRLRIQELAARLDKELSSSCSAPLMLAVSNREGPFISLAHAYEEAQTNMGREAFSRADDRSPASSTVAQFVSRMVELEDTMSQAIRETDRTAFEHTAEAQLRLVSGCPGAAGNARLCLFTTMVLGLLSSLRTVSEDTVTIDALRTHYALTMPSLRTVNDMIEWFHTHLLPLTKTILVEPRSVSRQIVAKACQMAAGRLLQQTGRDDVAAALGLSTTHFGKLFRKEAGMPYREFVRRLRASKAQKLLLLPGKTVAEVAADVGYSTTAAFSRGFEQVCGASPCAYRNNPQAFPRIVLPEAVEA